ncbi:MAG TPA: nuclear transport factor 2 family protein [Acidimicrobiia bacterium]|nr:nuclear transport factor 2 family protein [Acidimicrobiia bacterium]
MATHDQLATAFDAALTGRDPDDFVALLAPGAIVWHNHDRKEVDARENMAAIGMLGQLVENLKNERVLLSPTDNGFVLQFVIRGSVRSSGNDFEMQNCVVVTTTDDGLISRIDEYVDPTVGAQLA